MVLSGRSRKMRLNNSLPLLWARDGAGGMTVCIVIIVLNKMVIHICFIRLTFYFYFLNNIFKEWYSFTAFVNHVLGGTLKYTPTLSYQTLQNGRNVNN